MSDWLLLFGMGLVAALFWVGLPLGAVMAMGLAVWKFGLKRPVRWTPLLVSYAVVLLAASGLCVALLTRMPGPK